MLNKLNTIYLYKGATSVVEFDFTEFVFDLDSEAVFTLEDLSGKEKILEFRFTESTIYTCVFRDEVTAKLNAGKYKYNIMYLKSGERYPQCADSDVIVTEVVNQYGTNYNS